MPGKLILVRHGQSIWNVENLFTGWHDVDLSDLGRDEATQAGRELLAEKIDAPAKHRVRQMIEAAKEAQIFTAGQAGIKAQVAAGVIAELAAHRARVFDGVVTSDAGGSAGWND